MSSAQEKIERLTKMLTCTHDDACGGNDYILCNACGFMWDYRREPKADKHLLKFAANELVGISEAAERVQEGLRAERDQWEANYREECDLRTANIEALTRGVISRADAEAIALTAWTDWLKSGRGNFPDALSRAFQGSAEPPTPTVTSVPFDPNNNAVRIENAGYAPSVQSDPIPARHEVWQPIETAPRDRECLFWLVPKTADESYTDTSGNPIVSHFEPYAKQTWFGRWSSLIKATHWQHAPTPPAPPVSAPERPTRETLTDTDLVALMRLAQDLGCPDSGAGTADMFIEDIRTRVAALRVDIKRDALAHAREAVHRLDDAGEPRHWDDDYERGRHDAIREVLKALDALAASASDHTQEPPAGEQKREPCPACTGTGQPTEHNHPMPRR